VLRLKFSGGRQFSASKSPTSCSCKTLYASFRKKKATLENIKDICIGQDKWIKWIEIDQCEIAIEIDSAIKPTEQLWDYLETQCVRLCCGIDAYAFWPTDIERAKALLNNPNIKNEFIELRKKILSINEDIISSSYLNNLFNKVVFIELLDHIIDNL